MLRRLLIALLVLLVAGVVVVDRVGAVVAAHVLAGKLQSDEHLPHRPSASIGGFPFLTQAFGGKYDDVSVTAHDFKTPDGVPIATLTVHLHGVHIPFSKVLHGTVSRVPVDHADGSATVTFAGLAGYLAGQGTAVTLSRATSSSVDVIRKIPLGSRTGLAEGIATVTIHDDVITLAVGHISVSGLPRSAQSLARPFALTVPLRSLPFRIDVTSVNVTATGITGNGTANHVVLGS